MQNVSYTQKQIATEAAVANPKLSAGAVRVRFRTANDNTAAAESLQTSALKMDLTPGFGEAIVPGSVSFKLGGRTYFDRSGSLACDLNVMTGVFVDAGTINYATGELSIKSWTPGQAPAPSLKSLLTSLDSRLVDHASFRIPVSPVRVGSVQIMATKQDGGQITVTADTEGVISGPDVRGVVDYESGVVTIRFGRFVLAAGNTTQPWYSPDAVDANGKVFQPQQVYAETIRYNAVGFTYLPLDASILGLDPVRLPQDGRVAIFRAGGFAVIGHAKSVTAAVSNGQTIDAGRVRLSRVRVIGSDGVVINTGYTADLEAGTVTFTNVAGYAQPVTIEDRIEDLLQMSDVQINGQLAFTRQITHAYPAGSSVSSALIVGDMRARVESLFDQQTWDNTWQDTVKGANAPASFNDVLHPIEVTNRGAITERWAIVFTGANTFNVIGEHVGIIASGNTGVDCSPLNPATNTPYFTLRAAGLGNGWVQGNALRFDTVGAQFPFWTVRTIQQGPETVESDSFTILVRGDVDRP